MNNINSDKKVNEIKDLLNFDKGTETIRLEYTDHSTNSNKFYELSIFSDNKNSVVIAKWGRIGSKGTSQAKGLGSRSECSYLVHTLKNEKLKKGYKLV